SAIEHRLKQACNGCKIRMPEPEDSPSNWLQKTIAGHLPKRTIKSLDKGLCSIYLCSWLRYCLMNIMATGRWFVTT
ncbi:hypothetical protein, partial [Nitrosospira sp. Nsp14]|uniref:hypothetical protein n=1 Tax=Nitrosospira sp. Nsp14 TaxID=1855333 RepID=UPI001C433134